MREEINKSRKNDDKYFLKRFRHGERLRAHCKWMKEYAKRRPADFVGAFIFR